jgi:hypothetical protein
MLTKKTNMKKSKIRGKFHKRKIEVIFNVVSCSKQALSTQAGTKYVVPTPTNNKKFQLHSINTGTALLQKMVRGQVFELPRRDNHPDFINEEERRSSSFDSKEAGLTRFYMKLFKRNIAIYVGKNKRPAYKEDDPAGRITSMYDIRY